MLRRVVWQEFTGTSEVLTDSTISDRPDEGRSKHLRNAGSFYGTTRRSIPEQNRPWSVTYFNLWLTVSTFTSADVGTSASIPLNIPLTVILKL